MDDKRLQATFQTNLLYLQRLLQLHKKWLCSEKHGPGELVFLTTWHVGHRLLDYNQLNVSMQFDLIAICALSR